MQTIHLIPENEVEHFCRDAVRVAGWFGRVDMLEHWPLSRDEALTLIRQGEGLPVTDADLAALDQADVFHAPADGRWFAVHVCALMYCVHRLLEHYGVLGAPAKAQQ
ncbi:MAG: hypothetical protein L0215_27265 [Gemmataceae bacterium]|nr:hypothetical protein [Gemmataceae bacterium]